MGANAATGRPCFEMVVDSPFFSRGATIGEADSASPLPLLNNPCLASAYELDSAARISVKEISQAPSDGSAKPEQAAHNIPDEVGFRAAGRRRAADKVEHLAVLTAVIR